MKSTTVSPNSAIIDRLADTGMLPHESWLTLLDTHTPDDDAYAAMLARETAISHFGRRIYFRGIIEFTNICKNDCLYCGIRRSNTALSRYRLTQDEIMECCEQGYALGYRTFVLQGGEDSYFNDERLVGIVSAIRASYPDCAITLSVGERSRKSYEALFRAGADRYLLRHESADKIHYASLHPSGMSYDNRMRCLHDLREIGFQTGAGMMVGSPYQTSETLARDMEFLASFRPHMVGIGPFIPHRDTPFGAYPAGSGALTLFLLSLTRLMLPNVLLPATTALGTVDKCGRQAGVLAGCNVVMPNLSPMPVRKKYLLYDNKAGVECDAAHSIQLLRHQMNEIGYEVVSGRGDFGEGKKS